jgi:hypothetical protein
MAMNAIAQDDWQEQQDEPQVRIDGRLDPQLEDAYWQSVYFGESYYRAECEYDDYAPAYCVGYIGYAQYGGSFDDCEKSLCANWIRIKGDSRLTTKLWASTCWPPSASRRTTGSTRPLERPGGRAAKPSSRWLRPTRRYLVLTHDGAHDPSLQH